MEDDSAPAPRLPVAQPQFRAPRQVSRPKPVIQQEEELGVDPKIGHDFDDAYALSISEAKVIVDTVHRTRRTTDTSRNPLGGERVHNDSETITKFLEYFDNFSRFKQPETVNALSALLEAHPELSSPEKAQLGSLNCETADEAKTLIPSLANRLEDDKLQELLEEMQKLLRQDMIMEGRPDIGEVWLKYRPDGNDNL